MEILMKHTGSSASDLLVSYEVDQEEKCLMLTVPHFDSTLITQFILYMRDTLEVRFVFDDRCFMSIHSDWKIVAVIADQRYQLRVHQSYEDNWKYTVTLHPVRK